MLELVRYIHLNTLRAYLLKDLSALNTYPNTGHRMLMGIGKKNTMKLAKVLNISYKVFL